MAALPSTMVALKKLNDGPGLTYSENVPVPSVGQRDVLIAVTHAGICGTDRHIYEWDAWSKGRVKLGTTTGHEFVGRVVAVGPAVRRTSVGERVSAEGHIACGYCQLCRTGNGHICDKVDILGIDCNGCFAQFVVVPEDNVWPVHVDIPDHVAAVFDPLGNAMHTVMTAGVSGKSVLITGVGTIGLMAVTIAKAAGASRILVSDVDPNRRRLALELGADEAYAASDPGWVKEARDATHHLGPEVLLEMSGHPGAIRQGFQALRNGGVAALLGLPSQEVAFDLANDIIFKGATVIGVNGRRMFETWYQVQDFLLSGKLDLEPILTHQLEFTDFEQGFRKMQSGEAIKVVLNLPQESNTTCPTPHFKAGTVNS
ncbi:L-threonine 3-dehydrogenase [Lignipirellula cremea]|uniref:L-threonine 3-dehydrogenase n=1 Tax=Lignipirellula cremea TaxID=2528010 RepID=A0A518DY77_9BACT|nr:L-threonine 3-dehydrogenase [Lignipirellula cremea]QDU96745.1 L-threonine 3-dehydrogenase [Lignipirellula cremea]